MSLREFWSRHRPRWQKPPKPIMAGQVPAAWLDDLAELAEAFMCKSVRDGGHCDGHHTEADPFAVSGLYAVGRCEMAYRVRERIDGLRAGVDLPGAD